MKTYQALGFKTYQDYLNSEMWQEKKKWILECFGKRCQKCGATKALNVHHINYDSVGNENMHDVTVLCYDCHQEEHNE